MAGAWQAASTAPAPKTTSASSAASDEGGRRHEVLRLLTKLYVSRGAGVSDGMRGGVELAPAAFLNTELERQGAKWRVGNIQALDVEFFDIS